MLVYGPLEQLTDDQLKDRLRAETDEFILHEINQEIEHRKFIKELRDQRLRLEEIGAEIRELLPIALALDIICLIRGASK